MDNGITNTKAPEDSLLAILGGTNVAQRDRARKIVRDVLLSNAAVPAGAMFHLRRAEGMPLFSASRGWARMTAVASTVASAATGALSDTFIDISPDGRTLRLGSFRGGAYIEDNPDNPLTPEELRRATSMGMGGVAGDDRPVTEPRAEVGEP